MEQIERPVSKVARRGHCTVLIDGERGTGKGVVAHQIHQRSPRAERPFVDVDCTTTPCSIFESLLFGHREGTFTGANKARTGLLQSASGGTVFIDEVGTLCLEAQAKLLLFANDRTVRRLGDSEGEQIDVRIIAATNEDLEQLCQQGKFRWDLYDRLRTVPIHVPPLRERVDEIPALTEHFLRLYCEREGVTFKPLEEEELRALQSFPWPGNIRQLEHVVERYVVFECEPGELQRILRAEASAEVLPMSREPGGNSHPRDFSLRAAEDAAIRRAWAAAGGVKSKVADLLGTSLKTLYNRLAEPRFADLAGGETDSAVA